MQDRRFAVAVAFAASAIVCATAAADKPCGDWVLYKQCGEKWSNHLLGESSSTTICDAGCAMSSVAMALATKMERVDGKHTTPGTLNKWLSSHGGFVGGDELVWNAVAKLGPMHMTYFGSSYSAEQVRDATRKCNPVIANVRGGSHWVLVIGYDKADKDTFVVNDPGFPDTKYAYSGMSHFVVYSNHTGDAADTAAAAAAAEAVAAAAARPAARTSLAQAAQYSSGAPRASPAPIVIPRLGSPARAAPAPAPARAPAPAPGAPDVSVETCGFMKGLVRRTFSNHHDIWLCIAHAESSYEPRARNPSGATGLFQVMPMHCGSPGCPPAGADCVRELEDPGKNAACAKEVYRSQGFGAWTTYPGCARGGGPCQ